MTEGDTPSAFLLGEGFLGLSRSLVYYLQFPFLFFWAFLYFNRGYTVADLRGGGGAQTLSQKVSKEIINCCVLFNL